MSKAPTEEDLLLLQVTDALSWISFGLNVLIGIGYAYGNKIILFSSNIIHRLDKRSRKYPSTIFLFSFLAVCIARLVIIKTFQIKAISVIFVFFFCDIKSIIY